MDEIPVKCLTLRVDLTAEQRKIYMKLQVASNKEPVRMKGDIYKWLGMLLRAAASSRFYGGESSSKVDKVVEVIRHPALRGKRFLVYTRHHVMADHLIEKIKLVTSKVKRLSGRQSMEERVVIENELRSGDLDVAVITDAGGRGIRLEGASVVVFTERPWSGKAIEQIVGRAGRQGQKELFIVVVLILARDTKDDYVTTVIARKEKQANMFYGFETTLKGDRIKSLDDLLKDSGRRKEVWR